MTDEITKSGDIGTGAPGESFSAHFLELVCTGLNIPVFRRLVLVSISQIRYCLLSFDRSWELGSSI